MQSTNQSSTVKKINDPEGIISQGNDTPLWNGNLNQNVNDCNNIFRYHNEVIRQITVLKAAAEFDSESKEGYQEEFIMLSLQAMIVYSLLITYITRKLNVAGLKSHSNMILKGASIFLGGDAEGRFFQSIIEIAGSEFNNRTLSLRFTPYGKKEDAGVYIGMIGDLLKELKSFCNDHPLYNNFISRL